MDKTTHLALPYIMPSQAQKHITHNEALRVLDALVQLCVLDRDLATPPGSPTEGDRYVVAAGPTGDWAGHADEIAVFQDGAWAFFSVHAGWRLWIVDEGEYVVWDGSAWTPLSEASVNPAAMVGVNATADATNKLSVKSDAVLFDHDDVTPGTGDIRAVLNKDTAEDTASVVFQTGYSGRAELGLSGDDDWHVKVSADGSAWHEALVVDRNTGVVSFPNGAGSASPVIASAAGQVMNINPGGLIDQEALGPVSGDADYGVDGRILAKSGIAGTCTLTHGAETAVPGLNTRSRLLLPAEITGASDHASIRQPLEGVRMARLGWNAGGGAMTLAALIRSDVGGVKTLGIQRSDGGASYLMETADLTAGAVGFEYHIVPAPAYDAAWTDDETLWGWLTLCGAAGSSLQAGEETWQAGNYFAGTNHDNNDGDAEALDLIAWVLLPGIVPVTETDMPYLARSADSEFEICRRYLRSFIPGANNIPLPNGGGVVSSSDLARFFLNYETMRTTPSLIVSDATHFDVVAGSVYNCTAIALNAGVLECSISGASGGAACYIRSSGTDARLLLDARL